MNKYEEFFDGALTEKPWKAAIYIRLSKEDEKVGESGSVIAQREILKEYVRQQCNIEIVDFYVDDGWSGSNFSRPSFERMISDIEAKIVNCVIVKDLSRLGRNYIDTGSVIDSFFVERNIRLVVLNNGIDTASGSMNAATQCITVGVQNVINESVIATTSVNIRGTLNVRRQQGKFIGSFACYGYEKSPDDRHKLVIDEPAAQTVRQVFKWFIEGKSIIGITKTLNAMGVPNPSTYKKQKCPNYKHTSGKNNDGLWCESTVRRMLENEMYIGNMVQGKNKKLSYKSKKCVSVPKNEQIIVENTHEPIIDREVFDKAQSLFNRSIRTAPEKTEVDLFAGFVKCADCHRAMSKKTNNHSYGTYKYYRCVTSHKMYKGACTPHSIRIDKLENAVLTAIQTMIDTAVELDALLERINKKAAKNGEGFAEKSLKKMIDERDKTKKMMLELYPDWKSGVISKDEYLALKNSMDNKAKELDKKIADLEKMIKEDDEKSKQNDFLSHFARHGKIERLTRPILTELVDSILVHSDGNITINFKFTDAYEQLAEYIEQTKQKYLDDIA